MNRPFFWKQNREWFVYVYMLSDVATRTHHFVGMTEDIEKRSAKHNAGQVPQ